MISLLYATARPHLIGDVVTRWYDFTSEYIEIIVCTDEELDDTLLNHISDFFPYVKFSVNDGLPNCVAAYNQAASKARGDILVQISDDLYPCTYWDSLIASELNIQRNEVLLVSDDHLGRHAVTRHAICTRKYYEKMGYLLYPGYESMYSDNDFCAAAQIHADEVKDARKRIRFEHKRTFANDDVARQHEASGRYQSGLSTFLRRKALGFPK